MARPKPEEPPVTRATFEVSVPMLFRGVISADVPSEWPLKLVMVSEIWDWALAVAFVRRKKRSVDQ
jgi:hypothetical protein